MNSQYATPSYIASRHEYLDTLPIDGLTVYLQDGANSYNILNPTPIGVEAIASSLAPLAGLRWTNLEQNFGLLYSPDAFDVYDDVKWEVSAQNLRNYGQVLRAAGFKGILFDNENYRAWGDWAAGSPACDAELHSLAECQAQMRRRGRELMDALQSVFPDVVVLFFHDVNVSDQTFYERPHYRHFKNVVHANELVGPFTVGFVEAKGANAAVIQGGEYAFDAHAPADFDDIYRAQENAADDNGVPGDLHSRASGPHGFIPPALRPSWAIKVGRALAIYGYHNMDANGNPLSATSRTITNALTKTDRYAWIYMDVGARAHGSMITPAGSDSHAVTQAFLDAVRAGKAAAH